MKKKISIIIADIIVLYASTLLISHFAWAQSTTLFVNPPTTSVLVGESFTISLNVAYIDDLAGYNIYLRYNTTVLTATKVIVEGTWFTTGQTYTVWANSIDDNQGIVHASVTLTGVEEGVSGSGDLFRIVFTADSSGSSLLDIYNDMLVDPLFVAIPHSTSDGIVEATAHDVAVYNVMTSKTIVGQSFTLHINVTVANEGDYAETFDVTLYANTTPLGSQIATLASRSYTTITFTWNTTGFSKSSYTISAYATPTLGEVDTADNTLTNGIVKVVTPGDTNADGAVNILDLSGISAHWHPGPPIGPLGYNPNFDINCDGSINILEISIISAYWTGPPKGPLAP